MGNDTSVKFKLEQSYNLNHINILIVEANSFYILGNIKDGLCILKLNPDSSFSSIKVDYNQINNAEMHPNYKNVFLTIYYDELAIWEINENEKECVQKIMIKGNKKYIKALFCKNNDKQFVSYSEDRTIKIWSMENSFCIGSISVDRHTKNIEFFTDYLFYQEGSGYIVIYDPVKLKKISEIKNSLKNFFVIYKHYCNFSNYSTYNFILFDDNNIMLNSRYDKLNFQDKIEQIFYDDNLNIIYIFFINYLKIVYINEKDQTFEILFNIKNASQPNYYIDNHANNKFICGKFLEFFSNTIRIYSFISKKLYNPEKIEVLTNPNPSFWDNCMSTISNIEMLKLENNVIPPENDLILKNYLNDKEIKDEVILNFNKSLKQKRLEVANQIKDFHINENNLNSTYKDFIKMLIKDNTNKGLITKYLKFLKANENKIDYQYIVKFEDEYNYYRVMFEKDELQMSEFDSKDFSENELFINFLNSILKININHSDFFENVEKTLKNIQLFNQPISFNNKELYWHRNLFIVYTSLKKIKDIKSEKEKIDTLKLMQNAINNVFQRKLFQKKYTLNDKILLTILVSLIALPLKEEYCDYNLNLIESKDPDKKQDKSLNLNVSNDYEKIEETLSSDICLKNFVLHLNQKIILEKKELQNYDELEKFFKGIIDIENVNKILAKIFCSNVMKEAFNELYPEYFIFPFNDESEALEFIKENFHYIPYKSYKTGAISEKLTLESYFFLQIRKILFNRKDYTDNDIKLIEAVFYNGSTIKTNCHEMNHLFYDLLFLQSNGINEVETPKIYNIEISDNGKNLERLLFKRVLYRMTLPECMYILNEENYNKSLKDFRDDFNEINSYPLKIVENGIFSKFNSIYEIKNCKSLFANAIMVSDDNQDDGEIRFENFFIDEIEDDSDVLGFLRV